MNDQAIQEREKYIVGQAPTAQLNMGKHVFHKESKDK